MTDRQTRLDALDDKYGGEVVDGAPAQFALVERSTLTGECYTTTHASRDDAAGYVADSIFDGWWPIALVDLDTGETFDPDPSVSVAWRPAAQTAS